MLKELNDSNVQFDDSKDPALTEAHARQIYQVASQVKPDVWFKPTQVWEVQADCFTLSKVHSLGHTYLDKESQGLSLRFPRFIRRREDKSFHLPLQFFLDAASTVYGKDGE